ncbi:MAG: (E)-4-hydroxy-3-methylbut-2-enyl-diphosphate synthase [Treponema sp.]|nr:(E)-4-hydroxy-3-methylbut-2-enyl-diphosphate synthase [Treponema sp.]
MAKGGISKVVKLGGFAHVNTVCIGGGFPPVVQTMWKDRLSFEDLEGNAAEQIISRIENLGKMGCGVLRFAVPDLNAAEVLGNLASMVSMPLVADIHFDYKIALRCLDFPIAKIRINPGNIGGKDKVKAVLNKAAAASRPIRVGVNAGSLPRDLEPPAGDLGGNSLAEAMVLAAEREIAVFTEFGFTDVLVSMKASSIADTIRANRLFAERSDIPLHVGVTEAGPLIAGVVRNTAALVALLADGIGDTIRVSLSDTMEKEIIAGREILAAASEMAGTGENSPGVRIVSCPRCGRAGFDTHGFTERWQNRFYAMDKNITVAIMGCAVNGPGEARHADLGITGVGDKVLIFRRGEVTCTIDAAEADTAFEKELAKL